MAQLKKFALGLDFGTESVRAIAVSCDRGEEVAQSVHRYPQGVITRTLPGSREMLPPEFALQSAQDYLDCSREAIREVLKTVPASGICGVGVDFTACTILPCRKDGTPLMFLEGFKDNPHAWVKLWKHHAATPEAEQLGTLAHQRKERFLCYTSGVISSEWMLPKCWEIAKHAPEVYAQAELILDAGDWFVQQMTGEFTRNSCAAGYKGSWSEELGFPSVEFLKTCDPALSSLRDKWVQKIIAPGRQAGGISRKFSEATGLLEGTPVSAATIDAHSGVLGMGVCDEGAMSIIMGTSSCHMVLSRELRLFDGFAGVAKDGILPGFYGYESGQAAVGDIFGWFVKDFLGRTGTDPYAEISARASKLKPGQGGVLSLDWLNGNRSVLMNPSLSGLIVGLTLGSRPEEVYRSLIEATAFGTRIIVDSYLQAAIPCRKLVVCGGLVKDPLIMQIYADVTGLPVEVASSTQAVAVGAAIYGALSAGKSRGGFDQIDEAILSMTRAPVKTYLPENAQSQTRKMYEKLFKLYRELHDQFGGKNADLMRKLKEIHQNTVDISRD